MHHPGERILRIGKFRDAVCLPRTNTKDLLSSSSLAQSILRFVLTPDPIENVAAICTCKYAFKIPCFPDGIRNVLRLNGKLHQM